MKYLNQILATLLALPFVVFGANYFINFMPAPPMEGDPAVFAGVMYKTNYMLVIKIMEIIFGAMILFNIKRPLALLLIAPIVVNILMFELLVSHQPGIGIILIVLNAVLLMRYKSHYQSIIA